MKLEIIIIFLLAIVSLFSFSRKSSTKSALAATLYAIAAHTRQSSFVLSPVNGKSQNLTTPSRIYTLFNFPDQILPTQVSGGHLLLCQISLQFHTQGCAFWGFEWPPTILRGSKPPKNPKKGAWLGIFHNFTSTLCLQCNAMATPQHSVIGLQ